MFKFLNKAETIKSIYGKLKHSYVLPSLIFKVSQYEKNKESVLKQIQNNFNEKKLIIRSSSNDEDTDSNSLAGHYESILNVDSFSEIDLKNSIEKVIVSLNFDKDSSFFVQPMLEKMKFCGVIFTCDLDTLSPYYIINFDTNGSADAVTSGQKGNLRTIFHLKDSQTFDLDPLIKKLIESAQELELVFGNKKIDIEFGVNDKNEIFIFQVRPIITNDKLNYYSINLKDALLKVEKKIQKLSSPHPNLYGEKAVFGVMPDWNPAEIIGIKPRRLSLSLYKEFITDNIWAYQRDNYGYKNLRSHPLLISFLGVPYIDVRVDFNSFIPKSLDENIARKLVDHYLVKLINTPLLHDKIEFKIVHSCYYFGIEEKLNELKNQGFNSLEINKIKKSLLEITNNIITPKFGHFENDLNKIEELVQKQEIILKSNLSKIDKIYWLTEYCKRFGTLPFAGIARAAFISTQMLNSFVEHNVLSNGEKDEFLKSINTITSQMENDLRLFFQNKITKNQFLDKYGHLRPGTYDINSQRYDERFEEYFPNIPSTYNEKTSFVFNNKMIRKIYELINISQLNIQAEELIVFIKKSIESREYSKFVFTSCLSEILKLIEELGKSVNINKNDISYVDFKTILSLYNDLGNLSLKEIFEKDIEKYKDLYSYTTAVKLPSLITNKSDIYSFELMKEEPNFVSLSSIESQIIKESEINSVQDFQNKIVFIQSADPGYDYLFSKNIGGLITQYGGANSHMAVRCAELGIPAVIGAGEYNFNSWSKAKILMIDASKKKVNIIR